MNFGSSRVGYWFQRPPDRGYKKKALVFYDPLTNGPGGNTNYYASGDVNPATDVYPTLATKLAAQGMTATLVSSYSAVKALDLTQYSQIWDIGYASPYSTNPNDPTTKLYNYLQSGGAMFVLGENSNFGVRDDALDTFVIGIGGGTVTRSSTDYNYAVTTTVATEFLLANSNNSVNFSRPGTFTALGTGTAMTTAFTGSEYTSVMWKTGSLTGAPLGTIVGLLDINVFVGTSYDPDFVDNIILSLNKK